MASTNKTPQLGLNQWAAGDSVLREDFNGDNAKIDAAVAAGFKCVSGKFTGDSVVNRKIDVGFKPSCLIITGYCYGAYDCTAIAAKESVTIISQQGVSIYDSSAVALTDTGFILPKATFFNQVDHISSYLAFG